MANGRNPKRKGDSARDPGGFVALPWAVLDCPAYGLLSHPARSLLLEMARQVVVDNNGRLLASRAYLAKKGWKSADVIHRAKAELIAGGFIFETVKGHRPNKASWYAVTWRKLGKSSDFDYGAERAFEQGAYKRNAALSPGQRKSAILSPSGGTERAAIAPSDGTDRGAPGPSRGAIQGVFSPSAVPSSGHHLEKPSAAASAVGGPAVRPVDALVPTLASAA